MVRKEVLFLFNRGGLGRIMVGLVVALAILTLGTGAQAAITITNQSGSVIWIDDDVTDYNAVYLVFQIESDSAVADAWVKLVTGAGNIQNVGTGIHQLKFKPGAGTADPIEEAGLVAGEPKGVFFLVSASGVTGSSQNLTVEVYDGDPGGSGSLIGSDIFAFTAVADTIKANANKVHTVVTIPDNPVIGDLGKITVTGCTGTVKETSGYGWVLYFSPVSADTWPADKFEFVDSVIEIPGYSNTPYKNMAKIPTGDVLKEDHCYTETFTFVIVDEGSGTTTPANYIASGQQIKHTTNTSGTFDVIIPPAECPTITVTSTPATLPEGTYGVAYASATFNASGANGPFEFTVPAGALPDGMTLELSGLLHGTPTEVGTFNFTVTATNKDPLADPQDCTGTSQRSLTINCPTISVFLSGDTSLTDGGNTVITATPSGGASPYTYDWSASTASGTPSGNTFTADSGGTVSVTVTDDNGCTGSASVTVKESTESIPTLNEWGMIIMSLLLAGSAILIMRRRRGVAA